MFEFQITISAYLGGGALLVFLYVIWIVIYRLFLSPIANFPGPKLAAATWWYEFYYDGVLGGKYAFKIPDLHKKYGPVIRINPYELHFSDPEFYDTIYCSSASGLKRDKWYFSQGYLGVPETALTTLSHDLHRLRRSALNTFFSTASVRSVQPIIDRIVNKFLGRLEEFKESSEPIIIDRAFAAFTNDVISEYCFGSCADRVSMPGFDPESHNNLIEGLKIGILLKHNYWIMDILQAIPEKWAAIIAPAYGNFVAEQKEISLQATKILNSPKDQYDAQQRTIFHEIIDSKLPNSEKGVDRLAREGITIVGAGTITTAWTLAVAVYYILADPKILKKLRSELQTAIPDPSETPLLSTLDQLPYLRGVAQETLRLSYGVTNRPQRIPHEDAIFTDPSTGRQWIIPAGTPCSSSSVILHHNETNFPDSWEFLPERWIDNPRLDRYQVAFTKGTRACLGITLAYAELHLMLAGIFRRYGTKDCKLEGDNGILELFETERRDVLAIADYQVPGVWAGSKGVRVRISSVDS